MEKTPIVILHGWGRSGESMWPLASIFRENGFTVYTPDLPGFGSAEVPSRPWFVDDYVEWLKTYLDKNNLSRIILVTQSFGGRVAIKFAVKYPQYLEKLVMMGVPGMKERLSWKRWLFKMAIKIGKGMLLGATWEVILPWPIRKYIERKLSNLDYFRAQGVMRKTLENVIKENLKKYLSNITTPTLLIWGEEDEYVSLKTGKSVHVNIPNSQFVVIPKAKHGVYRTHSSEVASHIFRFLDDTIKVRG